MDKTWMRFPRNSEVYLLGLGQFLDFAFSQENTGVEGMILCPCKTCKNGICLSREDVEVHLRCVGFINGYTQWIAHGETSNFTTSTSFHNEPNDRDNMVEMLNDAFGVQYDDGDEMDDNEDKETEEPNSEAKLFYKLVDDSKEELWPGCKKFSKLSFLVRLYHIKCLGKMSNKVFTMLLDLLNEAFPEGVKLPKSNYEARKVVEELGLGYKKYDACSNDCTLFWGKDERKTRCETCSNTRWVVSDGDPTGEKRKVPHKVLWHFPLKARLQRLFLSSKTASFMRWHAESRTKDGNMRHPADSPAWQYFDFKNPEFAKDPRNVRLGLASDGFNPFKSMNVQHSTWPVVLIPYNLPPWMCMKQPYFMVSLLIPGPHAPGNNIDVYMQPLIAELKDLWDGGLDTYDASCKQNFKMRASLLWTISDFPGYANLSGWSTKGGLACPVCNKNTDSLWLKNSGKYCYLGHRRFLEKDHSFRNDCKSFNGNKEHRDPPSRMTGSSMLAYLNGFEMKFGKLFTFSEHYEAVKKEHLRCSKHEIERIHVGRFASWFVERAELLQDGDPISCDLKLLAKGPNSIGVRYKRILVNGFRFHTKEVESKRKTQNSGVMIKAATSSFSSTKDKNPILGEVAYYGVLKSIIELDYTHDRKVVLFDCDWVSQGNRIKQDEDVFTMVNFSDLKPHNEPFILASQAKQAFYVADPDNKVWHVAILSKARDVYDMDPIDSINMHLQSEVCSVLDTNQMNEELSWGREDAEGFVIEA